MSAKKQNLPAPTVKNSQNIELKEISIKGNGTHVNVVIAGLPDKTELTAHFLVKGHDRSIKGTTSGTTPLRLRLESGWYSEFSGKTATVMYTVGQEKSAELNIKIVD